MTLRRIRLYGWLVIKEKYGLNCQPYQVISKEYDDDERILLELSDDPSHPDAHPLVVYESPDNSNRFAFWKDRVWGFDVIE